MRHKQGNSKQRSMVSQFWGQDFWSQSAGGPCSPLWCQGRVSCQPQAFLGSLRHITPTLQTHMVFSHHLPSVSKFPLLQGYQSHWIRAHPDDLILTSPLEWPYFQTRCLSEVLRVRTSRHLSWDTIQPITMGLGLLAKKGSWTFQHVPYDQGTLITSFSSSYSWSCIS